MSRDGSKGTWLCVVGGGGEVKANLTNSRRSMLRFERLESVNVEVWPARVGQCWGLTDSSRFMLRFDRLESVSVEVWPTQVGRCWGLTGSSQSMLRFDQLESVNVEVWSTRILLLNKILTLAIFDGPIQSGFDQLSQDLTNSVSNIVGGLTPPPPPPWSDPWLWVFGQSVSGATWEWRMPSLQLAVLITSFLVLRMVQGLLS